MVKNNGFFSPQSHKGKLDERLFHRVVKIFPNICLVLLLMVSCQHAVGVVPDSNLQQAKELCLKDYRGMYLRGRDEARIRVVSCERMSRQEAGRRFPRVAAELTEDEYIFVNISRLPSGYAGGSAYYLVNARTGKIVNRYHTK